VRAHRGSSVGTVVIAKNGGAITISRTAIEADAARTEGIFAYGPTDGHYRVPPKPWRVRLDYVYVFGRSDALAIRIEGRPESSVSNPCIADGILLADRPAADTVDRLENLARDGRRSSALEASVSRRKSVPRPPRRYHDRCHGSEGPG